MAFKDEFLRPAIVGDQALSTTKTTTATNKEPHKSIIFDNTAKTDKRVKELVALGKGQVVLSKGDYRVYFFPSEKSSESGQSGQIGYGTFTNLANHSRFPITFRWFELAGKVSLTVNEPQSQGKDGKYYSDFRLSDEAKQLIFDTLIEGTITQ